MDSYKEIQLEKHSSQHKYIQLANALKDMIEKNLLKAGEKLPPIRKLADILKVNNVTVVNAYDLLEKEGYVYKKIGSGTYVASMVKPAFNSSNQLEYPVDEDFRIMDRGQILVKEHMISFASATPTPDLFPVEDFKILFNEVLDRDKGNAFGYQESQGYYPLRVALVTYLKEYGIFTKPENVQIISGAQQGIDVISKAFVGYGDSVIVESPTYAGAIATFKSRGAKIIDVPILEDGIDITMLEQKMISHQPKLIYVMPNFQNPTGYSYSLEKKKKLLKLAQKYQVLIVEDDYLSELGFYSQEHSTLKSLDMNGRVLYIKSFSKIFMPGLRLGFMVIPDNQFNQILAAKHASDISTSGLNQRTFELYLNKGIWKKHMTLMETIYKKRFDIMSRCLKTYIDPVELSYVLPKGGLNFWLTLPKEYSSNDLYTECAKQGILIVPGSVFFPSQSDSPFFRLSIASVYPEEIEKGIEKISEILKQFIYHRNQSRSQTETFFPLL